MDDLIRRSIQTVESNARSEVPWQSDVPSEQPVHKWDAREAVWKASTASHTKASESDASSSFEPLTLFSWNIDFMLPFPTSRMRAAFRHLQTLVQAQPTTTAIIIHLAECVASDLNFLASDPWVRATFLITDLSTADWESGYYGTTTLIDRRLPVQSVFRVQYSQTRMARDALFVDVVLGNSTLRLCNTHLESLANTPALRPPQMQLCARYMHASPTNAAILAGDLNAIQPFDADLPVDNGLKDAYLQTGGDVDAGHTWGQQATTAMRERFGTTRMDKVLYCGDVICTSFALFGAGIELDDAAEREAVVMLGFEKPWITDHLGVMATVEMEGGVQASL